MYREEIKEILKNTYDVCARTLDFGSSAASRRKKDEYFFYSLDKDDEEEILTLRNILESQFPKTEKSHLTELKQLWGKNKWELPQCAHYYVDSSNGWCLDFHDIKGVCYHRTFGKHIAATFILDGPLVQLFEHRLGPLYYNSNKGIWESDIFSNKSTLYGYWDKTEYNKNRYGDDQMVTEGINYRVNRNLLSNAQFRMFTTSFFSMIAKSKKKYILNDISRTINACGCFLPSVSLPKILECRTPADFFKTSVPETERLNINFNKIDMNVGYMIAKLSPFIWKQDFSTLLKLTPQTVRKCINLKNLFDGISSPESVEQFLSNYYIQERGFSKREYDDTIQDYIRMSLEGNTPIKLRSSLKKLKEAHDSLAQWFTMKEQLGAEQSALLVTTPSKFDNLEKRLNDCFPNALQRVHTSEQLLREGIFQHNCVFSRRDLIKNDKVSIFHWNYENMSYTIQFAVYRSGKYYIDEMKAKYNRKCTLSAMTRINEMLAAVNSAD